MPINNFQQFCPTDTGTNLIPQADYITNSDRISGNKPGVASSALNNRAARQANFITSNLAQLVSNLTNTDVLDDANSVKFLAQITAALTTIAPLTDIFKSGSGTYFTRYIFFTGSASATLGATYTNNSITYTVIATVAGGTQIVLAGNGDPLVSGTLTKASGTGDSSIVFYAVRIPKYLKVKMVGGGSGGCGGGTSGSGGGGSGGGDTTFGSSLLTAGGGTPGGGYNPGNAGSATIGSGASGLAFAGSRGGGGPFNNTAGTPAAFSTGAVGGSTPFGGGGSSGPAAGGSDAVANTGAGGGGGGCSTVASCTGGAGGTSGSYVEANIPSPLVANSFAWAVGTGGTAGSAAASGFDGGVGGSGIIAVESHY